MKSTCFLGFLLFMVSGVSGQVKYAVRDEQGRHVIPRGFVINTEDSYGNIYYTTDDYHRMVRMGADFQVIRLRLGKLGGYPGNDLDETYLVHLDSLVQMGKNAGLKTAVNRENIMYAPHIYEGDKTRIRKWIDQYEKDAKVSGVPIFFGEWGNATYDRVDSSLAQQFNYRDVYIETANVFDSLGVGTIKAWFTGTRFTGNSNNGPFTWSIFKDNQGVGTIERKYITDVIARPYPQCIAGDIMKFSVDHATRSLNMEIRTDNSKGASRIFIPADRYYPDGFTITVGEIVVICNPMKNTGLEVVEPGTGNSPAEFIWDPYRQQLVILKWPVDGKEIDVRVQPGIYQEILVR